MRGEEYLPNTMMSNDALVRSPRKDFIVQGLTHFSSSFPTGGLHGGIGSALLSLTGAIFVLGRMFHEVAPLVLPQIPPFSRLLRHVGVLTSDLFSICPTPAGAT